MPRKIVKTLVTRPAKNKGAKPAKALKDKRTRRVFTEEFRREALGWACGELGGGAVGAGEFERFVSVEGGAAEGVGADGGDAGSARA